MKHSHTENTQFVTYLCTIECSMFSFKLFWGIYGCHLKSIVIGIITVLSCSKMSPNSILIVNNQVFLHKKYPKNYDMPKKTIGIGAIILALVQMLHPSAIIQEKYPNPQQGHRLQNLLVVGREMRRINTQDQMAMIMHCDDCEGELLYCVEKFVRTEHIGPA